LKAKRWGIWLALFAGVLQTLLIFRSSHAAEQSRYEAMFVDGRRVEGNTISAWHDDNAQPKLDSTDLLNPGQPLRWLHDRRPTAPLLRDVETGFVEMVGGDRLVGTVLGYDSGDSTYQAGQLVEPQLLVRPEVNLAAPTDPPYEHVRVLARFVRRVVWSGEPQSELKPGTLFFRDGRSTTFRSLRWSREGVRLLTDGGLQSFQYRDLAEVHLPTMDFWEAYCTELALLDPDQNARLVRFHTITGMKLTGSTARAHILNNGGSPEHWFHMLQPSWSLDALWVPFATIDLRQYFAPQEVPLSRLLPSQVVQKSLLGGGWRWQADRNSQLGPLVSGGLHHGWGFGVHAMSELTFTLPAYAKTFRTRIGLDQSAGDGGCVRTRVFAKAAGQNAQQQLFQSDPLVGSARGVDTGDLTLPTSTDAVTLTLHVDPAHEDRPAGADPLDIRDALDWLDPLVQLDQAGLQQAVAATKTSWIPAWANWTVEPNGTEEIKLFNLWQPVLQNRTAFQVGMQTGSGGISLKRELELGADDRWLLIAVRRSGGAPGGSIYVRVAGEPLGEFEIPYFGNEIPKPITIPLGKYAGRKVKIELEQREATPPQPIIWAAMTIASQLPTVQMLFEDDARGLRPNPLPTGLAQLVDDDPYAGARCLRLSPADGEAISITNLDVRIRDKPLIGEFRYLRFAMRMKGNASLGIECLPTVVEQPPRRYDAGVGPPVLEGAARIFSSAPTEWIVKTQDLYANLGAYDLQEIRWLAAGKGEVQIDHIYLARSLEDFNDIGAQDPLALQQKAELAQQAAFSNALEKANAATVLVDVEGLHGTGVLITKEGFIATTGFAAVTPGKEAKVTLADGRVLPAITLGINRDYDAAMLKITTEGEYPFLEIGNSQALPADGRLAAIAFIGDLQRGARKGTSIVRYRKADANALWVSLLFERSYSGGPLIDREGRLMALVSRPFGPGGTLAMTSEQFKQSRDRLVRSEVWGAWPLALTPHSGLNLGLREEKLTITGLAGGGPAEKAGVKLGDELASFDGQAVKSFQEVLNLISQKMPDEKVTLQLNRAGQSITAEFVLGRRGEF